MKKDEVKLILENQQVIMNALGNMTHNQSDLDRLREQFKKTAPIVHDEKKGGN